MAITFQAFLRVLSALHKMAFSQAKNNIYTQWSKMGIKSLTLLERVEKTLMSPFLASEAVEAI